jgi:Arc/MetJ-type ribon-helix-helix transcriptional regulator
MSLLTITLNDTLDTFVNQQVSLGYQSKADVVRTALLKYQEDVLVEKVLRASQEIKEGKYFEGDLRKIINNFKKVSVNL